MSKPRILVVEDDITLRTGLCDALDEEGFDVTPAGDGHEARALLRTDEFDLLVFDVMLPGPSGLELLKDVRGRGSDVPVLMLTARGDEADKVVGLELGADDYVTKPFGLRELLARIRAMLRRRQGFSESASIRVERFALGALEIDLAAFEVRRQGEKPVALSPKEAAMLGLLYADLGKVVSRSRFLTEVWGSDQFVGDRTVDTHILHLRQKLEIDPKQPVYLRTVHGVGYRLQEE